MNVAKYLLLAMLALPVLELAAFVAVAAWIGFGTAFLLVLVGSLAGALLVRHAGGMQIARVRSVLSEGRIAAWPAQGLGGFALLGGFLLFIPGFITDVAAVLVLLGALFRTLTATPTAARSDGVVDLPPDEWRHVPDLRLPGRDRSAHEH